MLYDDKTGFGRRTDKVRAGPVGEMPTVWSVQHEQVGHGALNCSRPTRMPWPYPA